MLDWRGKVVLITGGTGSFGQAFTRLLLDTEPVAAIRVLSRDEFKQSDMQRRFEDARLRFLIGDVRDRERLLRAFDGVDIVIHAAAMKQVPACEYNPFEAVKTNVLGAEYVVDAAIERDVERVMALSTDKAANPVNLYGATKLCSEKLVVAGNAYVGAGRTRLSCVRYGNVVGSRGSVVPLLFEQRGSGRVTLTDPRMTRFWITPREAVGFVKRCVELMAGGEVFVPKMPSVRMIDVVKAIAPRARVDEIGIRPGEKLHEVLVTFDESRQAVDGGDFYAIGPQHPLWAGHRLNASAKEFTYSSDQNDRWLAAEEIAEALPKAMQDAHTWYPSFTAD